MEWISNLIFFMVGFLYIFDKERYYPNWKKIITTSFSCFVVAVILLTLIYSHIPFLAINLSGIFVSAGIGVLIAVPVYRKYKEINALFFSRESKINEILVFLEKIEFKDLENINTDSENNTSLYKKSEKILNDAKKLELEREPEIAVFRFFECVKKSVDNVGVKYIPKYHTLVFEGCYHIFINLIENLSERSVCSNYSCNETSVAGLFKLSNVGYHEATYTLGKYYLKGEHVKHNKDIGLQILRKAETQGSMKAHVILTGYSEIGQNDNNDSEFSDFLKNLEETLK